MQILDIAATLQMNHISKLLLTVLTLWFRFQPGAVTDAGDECFNGNMGTVAGEDRGGNSEEAIFDSGRQMSGYLKTIG